MAAAICFMAGTAFVFPGQGSQYLGMGKMLAVEFAEARRTFEEADQALRFPISKLCFEGPEEELRRTENTQPALLAVSIAAFRMLAADGYTPNLVAGHSLGEYSALVAAQSLEFGAALRLVKKRGHYMQEAVPQGQGAMAAILKFSQSKLKEILIEAAQGEVVAMANLNSPDQIVIAGHTAAVERAMELATAAGARRTVRLPVSAPFHCPLMRPAQEKLRMDLASTSFSDLSIPLINNWQAREIRSAAEAREGLVEQIPNPVRWCDSISLMAQKGITRIVEVGAGSVLTGLARQTNSSFQTFKFGEPADFGKLKSAWDRSQANE